MLIIVGVLIKINMIVLTGDNEAPKYKTKLPIKIWTEKLEDLDNYENAIVQAVNLANHPLARKWVCLMPDFHVGYGMPIGGVLATQGGVVPNAVGVDIGCGMIAVKTDLMLKDGTLDKDILQKIRLKIHEKVPVGMTHHKEKQNHPFVTWENATLYSVAKDPVISKQLERADYQIGTLGGGNHFIEIQKDEHNGIWIMIHCGSRNLGKQVCDYYDKKAREYMKIWHSNIPDMDLAFLPREVPEYRGYLNAMKFCMDFAEINRGVIADRVQEAFYEVLGVEYNEEMRFDTHHNFAAMENHGDDNLMIHRKGAVKADGMLTIPGSMGTASYICEGLRPKESFNTCSHGAGRVIGRKEANRRFTHEEAVESMKNVVFVIKEGDYDEMPMAYKSIDTVIKNQSDLVKPLYRLTPLAVCKG